MDFQIVGLFEGVMVVVRLCGGRSSSGLLRCVFVLGDDGMMSDMMSDMVLRCINQVSDGQGDSVHSSLTGTFRDLERMLKWMDFQRHVPGRVLVVSYVLVGALSLSPS